MFHYSLNLYIITLLVGVAFARPSHNDDFAVIITTEGGQIAGKYVETASSKFYSFQQIPYATPPIGFLRFQPPKPPQKWTGVLNTTENTKICVQFQASTDTRQSEDCLYLNVYTPADLQKAQTTQLPVIIWIHGGSFLSGSGAYDAWGPRFLMEKKIIIVSINYRLGPLGFLTTEDDVIPGNNGLRDQQLAMQWVQDNIAYFGGDPSKVTLMGQSAGAAAVGYHLLSVKSAGLYRAAIMDSSTPLSCWSLQKRAKQVASLYGHALDPSFTAGTSAQLLYLLQKASVSDLVAKSAVSLASGEQNCFDYLYLTWSPVMENERLLDPYVTGRAHEKLKNGEFEQVPLMIGFNSQEILLFDLNVISFQDQLFDANAAYIVNYNFDTEDSARLRAGTELKRIYTNSTFADDFASSVRLASDAVFTTPISRHAFLQSSYTPVFLYEFSYQGLMGQLLVNQTVVGAEGVGHQEELQYLFENAGNSDLSKFPQSDLTTQQRLLELWTSFATNLNPTKKRIDLLQNIIWPTLHQRSPAYLNINDTLTVQVNPKKYLEWSKIYNYFGDAILGTY